MSRRSIVFTFLGVLILVVVLVVAIAVPGEDTTRSIAVGGVAIALLKVVSDILEKEHERQKKEAERLDRLIADPVIVTSGQEKKGVEAMGLGVELYNDGPAHINIKWVTLHVNFPGRPPFAEHLVTPEHSQTHKLGPRDDVLFVSPNHTDRFTREELLALQDEAMWIEIESPIGKVAEVTGAAIRSALLQPTKTID